MCIIFLLSPSGIGQGFLLSKKEKEIPCIKALDILEKQYQVTFSYEVSILKNLTTSSSFSGPDLASTLKNILSPHQLSFREVAEGFVVIMPMDLSSQKKRPTTVIRGRILDQQSKEVISYAGIQIMGSKKGVYTDEYGSFQLVVSSDKTDSLLIRRMGYLPQKIAVSTFGDSVSKVIPLSPLASTLADVIITKEKIPPIQLGGEKGEITIIPREFTALPGWGEPDILRTAQQIPGINSSNESAGQLHIRGGTPDQNLLIWDNIPIYHLSHFFGMYSPFNPYISQKVEVYRGDYGVEYGGRVAGVIDITGRPDTLGLLKAGVGANLLHAHGFVEVPTTNNSVLLLSIRKSYTDWMESRFYRKLFDRVFQEGRLRENKYDEQDARNEPGYNVEFNPVFNFEDINAKWVFFPTKQDKVSLSFYQGRDRLDSDFLEGTPDITWWQSFNEVSLNNWGLSMEMEHNWRKDQNTAIRLLHSNYKNEQNLQDILLIDDMERITQYMENLMLEHKLSLLHTATYGQHTLMGGIDISQNNVSYTRTFSLSDDYFEGDSADITNYVVSPYLQHEYRNEKWYIRSGIRFNTINTNQRKFWEPRVSVSYFPLPALRLKASAGKFIQYTYQEVDYNELTVGENIWVTTEGDAYPVITSNHLSFSAFWNKDDWQIELSAYDRNSKNNLASFFNLREEDRSFQDEISSRGRGNMRGLDVWIKKKWGRYQNWIGYSLGKVTYNFPDIEGVDGDIPAPHDIRHIANWTHVYSSTHWDLSTQFSFTSGRPYTAVFLKRFPSENTPPPINPLANLPENLTELNNYHSNLGRESGDLFSENLPSTFRVDIAANYTVLIGKVRPVKAKVGFSIFNLFNRDNYFDVSYNVENPNEQLEDEMPSNVGEQAVQLPYLEETRRKMLGFTPNVFIRLEW